MTAGKVLSIILGILVIIAGVSCLFIPASGFITVVIIAAIAMIVEGIGSICTWNERRKVGDSSAWTLVGGIISIVLGVIVLFGRIAGFIYATIVIYFVVAWLIIVGIMRIVAAVKLRNFNKEHNIQNSPVSWGAILVLGILMVLVGIFGLVAPGTIAMLLGVLLGICVIAGGCGLIAVGCSK